MTYSANTPIFVTWTIASGLSLPSVTSLLVRSRTKLNKSGALKFCTSTYHQYKFIKVFHSELAKLQACVLVFILKKYVL